MLDLVAPGNEYANLGVLSILRLARVLRLLKLLRKVKSLRELQKLVKMMHTCIKALFWSFTFCFVVMTIWAMLIVEWIDPYVRDMVEEGLFEECGVFCETATTSVMKANLLEEGRFQGGQCELGGGTGGDCGQVGAQQIGRFKQLCKGMSTRFSHLQVPQKNVAF